MDEYRGLDSRRATPKPTANKNKKIADLNSLNTNLINRSMAIGFLSENLSLIPVFRQIDQRGSNPRPVEHNWAFYA